MTRDRSLAHFSKAFSPIDVSNEPLPKITASRLAHPLKAYLPMDLTDFGMVMLEMLVLPLKA